MLDAIQIDSKALEYATDALKQDADFQSAVTKLMEEGEVQSCKRQCPASFFSGDQDRGDRGGSRPKLA